MLRTVFGAMKKKDASVPKHEIIENIILKITKIVTTRDANYVACIFDTPTNESWKKLIYPDYRVKTESLPHEVKRLIPKLQEELSIMGIRTISIPFFESDDIINSIALALLKRNVPVTIISNEVKLLPLLKAGAQIEGHKPSQNNAIQQRNARWCYDNYSVTPEAILDLLTLMGDRGGVKGLQGAGKKRALQILEDYGSLNTFLQYAERSDIKGVSQEAIAEFTHLAHAYRAILTPRSDLKLGMNLSDLNISLNQDRDIYPHNKIANLLATDQPFASNKAPPIFFFKKNWN